MGEGDELDVAVVAPGVFEVDGCGEAFMVDCGVDFDEGAQGGDAVEEGFG